MLSDWEPSVGFGVNRILLIWDLGGFFGSGEFGICLLWFLVLFVSGSGGNRPILVFSGLGLW